MTERTPAQLRAAIEDAGGSLCIIDGHLRVFARPSALEALRAEIREHRHALLTLVHAYPCRGCGRTPGCTPLRCATCSALIANVKAPARAAW